MLLRIKLLNPMNVIYSSLQLTSILLKFPKPTKIRLNLTKGLTEVFQSSLLSQDIVAISLLKTCFCCVVIYGPLTEKMIFEFHVKDIPLIQMCFIGNNPANSWPISTVIVIVVG